MAFALSGVQHLMAVLRAHKRAVSTPIIRRAMAKTVQPVARQARTNAPVQTKLLKKSVGWRIKTYRGRHTIGIVGPRVGMGADVVRGRGRPRFSDPARYAHFVDRGTRRGVQPTYFLESAFDEAKAAAVFAAVVTGKLGQIK